MTILSSQVIRETPKKKKEKKSRNGKIKLMANNILKGIWRINEETLDLMTIFKIYVAKLTENYEH